MACPTEFVLNQYVDGELPEGEAMELSAHCEVCVICRKLVAALQAENKLLAESLQGIDWWEPERRLFQRDDREPAQIGRLAAILVGVAILLRVGYGLIMDLGPLTRLDWLFPLSLSGQLNWFANGFFYIIREGSSMMESLVNEVGLTLLSFFVLGCLLAMARRRTGTAALVGIMVLIVFSGLPGYAIGLRMEKQDGRSVTVAPDETIDDTLVALGETINIRGTITGDLITFARQVNIQGTVQGNVIGFAQRIEVTGDVGGDIFGLGQSIQVNGHVARSFWGCGMTLGVGTNGRLENDAMLCGTFIDIDGNVGRDLAAFGSSLDIGSAIGRNLYFRGDRLSVRTPSRIGGDLDARVRSKKDEQIDPGVTIAGKKKVELQPSKSSKYSKLGFYARQALRTGAAFLIGLLLLWLFPDVGRIRLSTGRALLTSGGIGFLAAIATPVAAIILVITIIGIPIALTAIGFWLLGLYLAKIIVAKWIGGSILETKGNGMAATALALLFGLIVVTVAVNLPYIGGVLNLLLILIGLGALVTITYDALRRHPKDAAI